MIVEVVKVDDVIKHPDADRLEIVSVAGTQFVSGLDDFAINDHCVYFPPDTVVNPDTISPMIKKYLKTGNRVGAIRLRGIPSFGFGIKTDDPVGTDRTEYYGASHWQPPESFGGGTMDTPGIFQYTSIQHYYKHQGVFDDKDVVITEKIHGMNCRVGICKGKIFAGSHRRLRTTGSVFGTPLVTIAAYLLDNEDHNITIFGELFGHGIQFMDYNQYNGFRVFDIMLDGAYMNWAGVKAICSVYELPIVPTLYEGPYYDGLIEEYTDGPAFQLSTGKFKGREGIVIKTVSEERCHSLGRLILKSVSADYYEAN